MAMLVDSDTGQKEGEESVEGIITYQVADCSSAVRAVYLLLILVLVLILLRRQATREIIVHILYIQFYIYQQQL